MAQRISFESPATTVTAEIEAVPEQECVKITLDGGLSRMSFLMHRREAERVILALHLALRDLPE